MAFNQQLGKLGFLIESESFNGTRYFRWIMTEDGKPCEMKSEYFASRAEAEKAAAELKKEFPEAQIEGIAPDLSNLESVKTCQRCGVTKQWSDAQK